MDVHGMSSYQRLKKDFENLKEEYNKIRKERKIYFNTLMQIAYLKGPDVKEGPLKAMDALIEASMNDEKKQNKD